jgi:hypothetical protein
MEELHMARKEHAAVPSLYLKLFFFARASIHDYHKYFGAHQSLFRVISGIATSFNLGSLPTHLNLSVRLGHPP